MRLVVARCSVQYAGRLDASLPEAIRLIMVKSDGCVAVHSDGGAYKPLNWMTAPNSIVESEDCWIVTNPKGETLTIILHEVFSDHRHDLGDDPGLAKDGVEAHLQEIAGFMPGDQLPPRVELRTGDSTPAQRRSLREDPPDILLTTPES
ncbi:MAG: endonuclease, partial [Actinomycetota bacterium]